MGGLGTVINVVTIVAGTAIGLLASTWATACRELGMPRARGVVFATNVSSAAAFREAGFVEVGVVREGEPGVTLSA